MTPEQALNVLNNIGLYATIYLKGAPLNGVQYKELSQALKTFADIIKGQKEG